MKLLLLGLVGLLILGLALFALIRWAQRRHLQEMMESGGLLRSERGVKAAICFMGKESEKWLSVDLYLSPKRICAFRSALHPPLIHVPFENSSLEVLFASSVDSEKRSYLGLGAPSRQGEIRFFLNDARDWLCKIEQLNNLCRPDTCADYDPAKCATTCPAVDTQTAQEFNC